MRIIIVDAKSRKKVESNARILHAKPSMKFEIMLPQLTGHGDCYSKIQVLTIAYDNSS